MVLPVVDAAAASSKKKKSYTEKELKELEEKWLEEEGEDEDAIIIKKKDKDGKLLPPELKGQKPKMIFVQLPLDLDAKGIAVRAGVFKSLLETDSVDVNIYPIDGNKILVATEQGGKWKDPLKVQKFLAQREDVAFFEIDQVRTYNNNKFGREEKLKEEARQGKKVTTVVEEKAAKTKAINEATKYWEDKKKEYKKEDL